MKKIVYKKWVQIVLIGFFFVGLTACQKKPAVTEESTKESANTVEVETIVDWPYYDIIKDDQVVGHLLGTMHVGKKEMYPFPEQILADLAASSLLITEIKMQDMQEPDTELLMAAIQGDQPITEGMTEESLSLFRERLTEYGYKEESVEGLNLFGVDQFLQTKYFSPLAATYGVETQLYGKAKTIEGLKNIGFETIEEQYDLLLSTYDDFGDVNEWVKQIPTLKEGKADSNELMAAYMNGEIFDYFTEEKLTAIEKKQMTVLLDQRNEKWLTVLPTYLEVEKGVVVAVGAGHLPGEKGVLTLLEKAGYQTKKVTFN